MMIIVIYRIFASVEYPHKNSLMNKENCFLVVNKENSFMVMRRGMVIKHKGGVGNPP